MKVRFFFIAAVYIFAFLGSTFFVDAASAASLKGDIYGQLNEGAQAAEMGNPEDPRIVVARIIQIMLSLIGMIFMVLVIMAGYWRMTANGDESKIEKSNNTMVSAIIGIIIVFMAYIITTFVLTRIQNATSSSPVYDVNDSVPNTQYNIPALDVDPNKGFCLFGKCF